MHKTLFILSLWFAAAGATHAEDLVLTDGAKLSGEIVKADDQGLIFRLPGDVYVATNLTWLQLSQDTLKHLADNPRIGSYATPFVLPPAAPEIKMNPVTRLALPEHPSLFGGLAKSSVGLFILLVLYAANLYAGYEVALVRGRSIVVVMGLAAVLPVIGPMVILSLPVKVEPQPEEAAAEATPDAESSQAEEIHIAEASWQQMEKPAAKPQVFTRGKFTFNKRFIETRFADFLGSATGETEKKFTMEVSTANNHFAIVRLVQISAEAVVFDAVQRGPVTLPLIDIQEIKLIPKAA